MHVEKNSFNLKRFFTFLTLASILSLDVQAQEASSEVSTSRTSTGSVDENQKSKFGITYYFLGGQTYYNDDRYSNVEFYDSYVSFNYKISSDLRIAARPAFAYSVSNTGKNGNPQTGSTKEVIDKSRNRDFSFVMTSYNTAEDFLPADLSYKLQFRYYIPTSDASKDQGMIGRLQVENELKQKFLKYSNIRMYVKPSYYFQRNKTYVKYGTYNSTTSLADSEHGFEVSYSLSKLFALKPGLNFKDQWSNESVNNEDAKASAHRSVLDYRMGLEVNPSKIFGFTFGVQYEQDLIQTKKAKEWSYTVLASGVIF